jgi:hypothetical protein
MEKTARVISCNGDTQAVIFGFEYIDAMNKLRDAHRERWISENHLENEDKRRYYNSLYSWTIKEVPIV